MLGHPNLKGRWPMDGSSTDVSGNGYNGTDANISYDAGVFGSCAAFNGSSSSITVGSVSSFSFIQNTGEFTICFWIKAASIPDSSAYDVVMANAFTATHRGFAIFLSNRGTGSIEIQTYKGSAGAGMDIYTGTSAIASTGVWYHVAIAIKYDSSSAFIYVDGVAKSVTTTFTSKASGDSTYTLSFGKWTYTPPAWLSSSLEDIQIYNKQLPQSDIQRVMRGLHPLTRS